MTTAPRFSFARLALFTVGAGVVVLAISAVVVIGLAEVSPVAALIVALLALILAIVAMGIVANRMVDRVARAMREEADQSEIEGD
jgi:flagellar biosynthesis component FlhA